MSTIKTDSELELNKMKIPSNLVLTASRGGKHDDLI